jgi:hypothetical protein
MNQDTGSDSTALSRTYIHVLMNERELDYAALLV